jgi:MarR family transcriptional regulator, organic hydroperoxide resistance regulator
MPRDAVETVLECYPRIFLACHRTHVRDPRSRRVLSAHQASVLDHLDAVEPITLRELAAHTGVTASSMSLMIDRLERGGYVRRSRDREDARRVNLRLTPAGARIKREQKVLDPERIAPLLRRLKPEELAAALTGLEILARAAGELMTSATRSSKKHSTRKAWS